MLQLPYSSYIRLYGFTALLLVQSLATKHQRNKRQDEADYRAKSSRQPCRFKGLHHSLFKQGSDFIAERLQAGPGLRAKLRRSIIRVLRQVDGFRLQVAGIDVRVGLLQPVTNQWVELRRDGGVLLHNLYSIVAGLLHV